MYNTSMRKSLSTKDKIKSAALELFNSGDTLTVTTNHIAKQAKLSPGNLYYHYKNKEEIIKDIYIDMSSEFESYNSFELILSSENPLEILSMMYDKYGELFWKYKFLVRDISTLLAMYPDLKNIFLERQEKRFLQIQSVLKYLVNLDIIDIPKDEIPLRAKLNWFISSYWQIFTSISGEVTKESIKETKYIVFNMQLFPYLTAKGKTLVNFNI